MTDVVQVRITNEQFLQEALGSSREITIQQRVQDLENAQREILAVLEQAKIDLVHAEGEAAGKLEIVKRETEPIFVPRHSAYLYGHSLVEQLYEKLQLRFDTALSIIRENQ